MSEDDTTYEGEFSDDWTLSGKVNAQIRASQLNFRAHVPHFCFESLKCDSSNVLL